MNFHVLTLFPEAVHGGVNHSIIKRAIDAGHIGIEAINIRDFAEGRHAQCDDAPYGGGAGMVMMAPPVYAAYSHVKARVAPNTRVVYLTPQGVPFTQEKAAELAKETDLILLCGHYEGIDERVLEEIVTDEISIGDYVLTGGELAACVVIDAVARLVGGVLHNADSSRDESFAETEIDGKPAKLLEYPQYTRPFEFMGKTVPDVLLSGHHKNIDEWRRAQAVERTRRKRPDLIYSELRPFWS